MFTLVLSKADCGRHQRSEFVQSFLRWTKPKQEDCTPVVVRMWTGPTCYVQRSDCRQTGSTSGEDWQCRLQWTCDKTASERRHYRST